MTPVRLIALLLTLALAACAPRPVPGPAELPDDFALGITVLPGVGMDPAWYILEPDGELRIATGERQSSSVRPGVVRQLSRAQVRRVWESAAAAGLTSHARPGARTGPTQATALGAAAIVDLSAVGGRSTIAIPRSETRSVEGVREVVALLRELAWLEEGR